MSISRAKGLINSPVIMPIINTIYSRKFHSRKLPFVHVNNIWQLKYTCSLLLSIGALLLLTTKSIHFPLPQRNSTCNEQRVLSEKTRVCGLQETNFSSLLKYRKWKPNEPHLTAKCNSGERYAAYSHTKLLTDKIMSPADVSDILKYVMKLISKKCHYFTYCRRGN